jgi:hypothetical protein
MCYLAVVYVIYELGEEDGRVNNNIIIFILLQVGCNPVAVVMLHVYKH